MQTIREYGLWFWIRCLCWRWSLSREERRRYRDWCTWMDALKR